MQVTIEIPDGIAEQIARAGGDAQRALLEAFAAEEYRRGNVSRGQVSEILGLNFWETEEFLKNHEAYLQFDLDSLDNDTQKLTDLLSR